MFFNYSLIVPDLMTINGLLRFSLKGELEIMLEQALFKTTPYCFLYILELGLE